jgi:hypothetical protein
MVHKNVSWKFPAKDFIFHKIETVFVAFLLALIFLIICFSNGCLQATLYTLLFLAIYLVVSYSLQRLRKVEEKYLLTKTHLHVTRKVNKKVKKHKVHLKDIKHHKLDKFFLGGYMLTYKKKKHLLFFNSRDEVEKFEKVLKKHLKPAGKKK